MAQVLRDKIPNTPLTGRELAAYACFLLDRVCESRGVLPMEEIAMAVEAMRTAMQNDHVFGAMPAYPGCKFEIPCQFHIIGDRFAFTVAPVFTFNRTFEPTHAPFIRRPVGVSAPPLLDADPDAQHVIDCLTISTTVENPNLIRVRCGMPVEIVQQKRPEFGQLFGTIERHAVEYDPNEYPPLPEPTVTDQTAQFAREWKVKQYEADPFDPPKRKRRKKSGAPA
jgi:hypothetical protein